MSLGVTANAAATPLAHLAIWRQKVELILDLQKKNQSKW